MPESTKWSVKKVLAANPQLVEDTLNEFETTGFEVVQVLPVRVGTTDFIQIIARKKLSF